jgi:hypothetical protein
MMAYIVVPVGSFLLLETSPNGSALLLDNRSLIGQSLGSPDGLDQCFEVLIKQTCGVSPLFDVAKDDLQVDEEEGEDLRNTSVPDKISRCTHTQFVDDLDRRRVGLLQGASGWWRGEQCATGSCPLAS